MIKTVQPVCFKWMTETSMLLPKIEYIRNSSSFYFFLSPLSLPLPLQTSRHGVWNGWPSPTALAHSHLSVSVLSTCEMLMPQIHVCGDISPFTKKSQEGTGISVLLCERLVPLLNAGPVQWKSLSHVWLFATPWTIQSSGILAWSRILDTEYWIQNTGVGRLSLLQGIFAIQVSCITGRFFTSWATREAQEYWSV